MNIQLGVICMDMVDFLKPGHSYYVLLIVWIGLCNVGVLWSYHLLLLTTITSEVL